MVGSGNGMVYGFDPKTGQQKWQPFPIESPIQAPLCADNGTVYIYGRDSSLYAVEAQNGRGALVYKTNQ